MLQQLYREEEAREAAWETARKAVEQVGGDIRVCEKQIASCEAEQGKACLLYTSFFFTKKQSMVKYN